MIAVDPHHPPPPCAQRPWCSILCEASRVMHSTPCNLPPRPQAMVIAVDPEGAPGYHLSTRVCEHKAGIITDNLVSYQARAERRAAVFKGWMKRGKAQLPQWRTSGIMELSPTLAGEAKVKSSGPLPPPEEEQLWERLQV